MRARGDLVRGRRDRRGEVVAQHADARVHPRRSALDQPERADLRALQTPARDREVLHRPLRLRPPQRVRGHPDLAHGVVLDTEPVSGVGLHATSLPVRRRLSSRSCRRAGPQWIGLRRPGERRRGHVRVPPPGPSLHQDEGARRRGRTWMPSANGWNSWGTSWLTPLTVLPEERIAAALTATFDAPGVLLPQPAAIRGRWSSGSTRRRCSAPRVQAEWVRLSIEAPTCHPLLRYYLATGDLDAAAGRRRAVGPGRPAGTGPVGRAQPVLRHRAPARDPAATRAPRGLRWFVLGRPDAFCADGCTWPAACRS